MPSAGRCSPRSAVGSSRPTALPCRLAAFGEGLTANRRRWGPSFGEIFAELEKADDAAGGPRGSYRENYSLLSNIAHGSPPNLVHSYAQGVVPIHDDRLVSSLLTLGSMYSLISAATWNEHFGGIDLKDLEELRDRAIALWNQRKPPG
jgi:hypothetical protein